VGPELLELAEEFATLQAEAGIETPDLDALLACVARPPRAPEPEELPS
jgi:hypothetical protein